MTPNPITPNNWDSLLFSPISSFSLPISSSKLGSDPQINHYHFLQQSTLNPTIPFYKPLLFLSSYLHLNSSFCLFSYIFLLSLNPHQLGLSSNALQSQSSVLALFRDKSQFKIFYTLGAPVK
ncbi:hypothetical protein PGT21_020951 [Puccinia graminis f. sp. tritici]|uniref:Uncharacterized protein n=1 Tax=Puccinia graminis f. sp. tritici TaxID=56615 RepID=A0A5B0PY29_PUCGR|nr:hypothetical protein PGT21_020951 [Puccinia graminis f. sp. tritici]